MILFFIALFIFAFAGLLLLLNTRTAKLENLAKTLNIRFDKDRENVTTEDTAWRLEFFTQYFHQYENVFTFANTTAFLRMADDKIFLEENAKPLSLTLFTAEFKQKQFPAFKIVPVNSPFASSQYTLIKTNIKELDEKYRFHAPTPAAQAFLTPALISLLKNRSSIYLEVNDNALIYHEHTLCPVENIQIFRLRGLEIVQELEQTLNKLNDSTAGEKTIRLSKQQAQKSAADQAEAMLAALSISRQEIQSPKKSWLGVGLLALLLALIGISLLAWGLLGRLPK